MCTDSLSRAGLDNGIILLIGQLRSMLVSCCRFLGSAVELFMAVARLTSHAALQSMQLDDSGLREYTHGTFACLAKVLGPDFVPYLQRCMDLAATSIELVGDLACRFL